MGNTTGVLSSVVRVAGRSTRIEIEGRPGATLSVDGGDTARRDDGSVEVVPSSSTVRIVCPEHTDMVVSTSSGRVVVRGHVASVKVMTTSGTVTIERTIDADVRTMSGKVEVDDCIHGCCVVTKSGHVTVGRAHDVSVSTSSARVDVGTADLATIHTTSGRIEVGGSPNARLRVQSLSGRVRITLPSDTAATTSLVSRSGSVCCDVPVGDGARVEATTTSGAIEVGFR